MIFVFNDFLSQGDLSVGSDQQLINIMIYALSIKGNQKFWFQIKNISPTGRCLNILYAVLDSQLFTLGGFYFSVSHQVCLISHQNDNLKSYKCQYNNQDGK